jgi:hypothetical protein
VPDGAPGSGGPGAVCASSAASASGLSEALPVVPNGPTVPAKWDTLIHCGMWLEGSFKRTICGIIGRMDLTSPFLASRSNGEREVIAKIELQR